MPRFIHPTAQVDPKAILGENVSIGPFCLIGPEVTLGDDNVLFSHVVINGKVVIGSSNQFYPFVTVGLEPQDIKYKNEPTSVQIGSNNIIREYVSIHRGTIQGHGTTQIGSHNMLMAYAHVAHDCILGNQIVMTNAASLAGHCIVEDYAVIAAFSGIHQFCRIGKYSFIGAFSVIPQDVAPFIHVVGNRAQVYGINAVGLKRAGFSKEIIEYLNKAFHILFRSRLPIPDALQKVREELPKIPELEYLCHFVETSQRGIIQ